MIIIIVLSINYVMSNLNIKYRMYEDDVESTVIDLNNAIDRKRNNKTISYETCRL